MRVLAVVVVMAACGRIGFDASPTGVDGSAGSGSGSSAAGDGETCTSARRIAIGTTLTGESLANARNDHPSTLCGGGVEVVYAFDQPAMVNRKMSVIGDFNGVFWYATQCPPVPSSCAGFDGPSSPVLLETSFAPGTVYLVIDKNGGPGTTFMLSLE